MRINFRTRKTCPTLMVGTSGHWFFVLQISPKQLVINPNFWAYVELRASIGRRKVAEKLIMQTLPKLPPLVLVVRRNLFTGVITEEKNTREWTSVN